MGGNAFPTPAARLSQDQYLAIQAHLLPRLASMQCFQGLRVPRHLGEKVDHGDLDVLCGWTQPIVSGEEEWIPAAAASAAAPIVAPESTDMKSGILVVAQDPYASAGHIHIMGGKKPVDPQLLADIRSLCARVMVVTGATAWRRRGEVTSFKLPTEVLGVPGDEFYQFDLIMTPPESLEWTAFIASYGATTLIVGRMLVQLSHTFALDMDHLALRHSPYLGIPPIEVHLTLDPVAFCEWFGLDWVQWQGETFETEKDFWRWLTNVSRGGDPLSSANSEGESTEKRAARPVVDSCEKSSTAESDNDVSSSETRTPRSLAARALIRMVKRDREKVYANPNSKNAIRARPVGRFYLWLQIESEWAQYRVSPEAVTQTDASASKTASELPSATISVAIAPTLPATDASPTTPKIPGAYATSSSPAGGTNMSALDPSRPEPLDSRAQAALEYWGVTEVYTKQLEDRKEKATYIAERQKERERRRLEAALASASGGGSTPTANPRSWCD